MFYLPAPPAPIMAPKGFYCAGLGAFPYALSVLLLCLALALAMAGAALRVGRYEEDKSQDAIKVSAGLD